MPGSFWTGYTAPTSPIYLEYLMRGLQALGNVAQQYGENQQANKLMNTENPPRAALVAAPAVPMNPSGAAGSLAGGAPQMESAAQWGAQNPNIPISGTQPFSGGVKGMEMQMALNRQNQTAQNQQLENQYKLYQMGNMRSEMASRNTANQWLYPQGTNRFTPMPAKTNTAAMSNPWNLDPRLLDSRGNIPEHVSTAMGNLAGVNQQIQSNVGVDIETFIKTKDWRDDGQGNMVSNSLAARTGSPVVVPHDTFLQLKNSAAGAFGQYQNLNAQGYGEYLKRMIGSQGESINQSAYPQQTPSPQQFSNVAGQTGKNQTTIGGAQQQQPLPNPITGSQFIQGQLGNNAWSQ